MKFFNPDSRLMVFLTRVADLVLLNVLWLLCCIPIVTIGASTTAMYHVLRHLQNDEISGVTRDFFQCFKADFRQSTPVYLVLLVPTAAVVYNFFLIFMPENAELIPSYLSVVWMFSALLVAFVGSMAFPFMAHFSDTLWHTLRNSAVLALAKLPRTILVTVLNLSPIILMFISVDFFLRSSIFWLLIGGALVAYLNLMILRPVFQKLIENREGAAKPDALADPEN